MATVTATGFIDGLTPGTTTISYTRTNACGTSAATYVITVNAIAEAGTLSGADSFCIGDTVQLTASLAGGVWSSRHSWIASTTGTSGRVVAMFPGSAQIMYVMANACSADTAYHTIVVRTQLECETSVPVSQALAAGCRMFPNPATDEVTFETQKQGTLAVYTTDGRVVGLYQISQRTTVLSLGDGLASGIYMCRFAAADGSSEVIRLSIQK